MPVSTWFQSLIGNLIIMTNAPVGDLVEFQSLIGNLIITSVLTGYSAITMFQSLIGNLIIGEIGGAGGGGLSFNPS